MFLLSSSFFALLKSPGLSGVNSSYQHSHCLLRIPLSPSWSDAWVFSEDAPFSAVLSRAALSPQPSSHWLWIWSPGSNYCLWPLSHPLSKKPQLLSLMSLDHLIQPSSLLPSCTDWITPWSPASSRLWCFLQNLPSHPGSCCFCHRLPGHSPEQWVSMVACFDFRDYLATHGGIFNCLCLGDAPDAGVVVRLQGHY